MKFSIKNYKRDIRRYSIKKLIKSQKSLSKIIFIMFALLMIVLTLIAVMQ